MMYLERNRMAKYYWLFVLILVTSQALGQENHFTNRNISVDLLTWNTNSHEIGPSLAGDTLFYSFLKVNELAEEEEQNEYYHIYKICLNETGDPVSSPVIDQQKSTKYHDGPLCYHPGNGKYFISHSNSKYPRKDYYGKRRRIVEIKIDEYLPVNNGKGLIRKPFKYTSKQYSIMHPSINTTGDTLYFSSDMPGGFGGADLYRCVWRNGEWQKPENLGENVNSSYDELFPHITAMGILYFSSWRSAGYGGLDIYACRSLDFGRFAKAELLAPPINSEDDDFGLVMSVIGDYGFFTSNRKGEGNDDIYKISINNEPKPEVLSDMLKLDKMLKEKSLEQNFWEAFNMHNLLFAYNQWNLSVEAKLELDKLVDFMKRYPQVCIEIGSHTDSRGTASYNLELSLNRSLAVQYYLEEQGINLKRMEVYGYGEREPVNKCTDGVACPEYMHQQNRRTEIKLIDTDQIVIRDEVINKDKYFLVAAGFKNKRYAANFLNKKRKEGYNAQNIGVVNGLICITLDAFPDLESAENRKKQIERNMPGKELWIYFKK